MKMGLFLLFLICAVWQDGRTREIRGELLLIFGVIGTVSCFALERQPWLILTSSAVGMVILFLSHVTQGGIGSGDGWFFIIAGLFLNPLENIMLFLSGLFFCGLFGLALSAAAFVRQRQIRKLRVPFLPFLIPACLWLRFI